jgi:hypothetical protein
MGKVGEKQKRRPKIKDKKQSERIKEVARLLGADQESDVFAQLVTEVAKQAPESRDPGRWIKTKIKIGAENPAGKKKPA